MSEIGINLQVHYIPVHMQPYYRGLGFKAGRFPKAEKFYKEEVSDNVANLSSVLEPALLLIMGGLVGFVAISIITPIYQITQAF